MESAKKWRRQNPTNGMYCSRRRRVLVDRKVRASLVIVGRVRSQQMAEMPLVEHDNVVKTFPPDRTDRPFTISVLPRRSRRGWPIPNAHRPKAADEDVTVDGVAVTNDVSRRYFPTIGLGELVRNPIQPLGAQSPPATGFGGDRDAVAAARRAVGMRLSEPQTGRSTRCRRRDYEGTSSTLGTAVAFPAPYTLQRWFARHPCRA